MRSTRAMVAGPTAAASRSRRVVILHGFRGSPALCVEAFGHI